MSPQQEIRPLTDRYSQGSSYHAPHWEGIFEDSLQTLGDHPEILRDSLLGTGR